MAALALAEESTSAAVPAALVVAVVRLATKVLAGTAVIPVRISALMEGGLRAMFLTKLKVGAALLLLTAAVVGGASVLAQPGPLGDEPVARAQPAWPEPDKTRPVAPVPEQDKAGRKAEEKVERIVQELRVLDLKVETMVEELRRHEAALSETRRELRLALVEAEELIRLTERLHVSQREREQAELNALAKRAADAGADQEKIRARITVLEAQFHKKERERLAEVIEVRRKAVTLEERLRLAERQHQVEGEVLRIRLEAVRARILRLEGALPLGMGMLGDRD
jgi:hypothetical protein